MTYHILYLPGLGDPYDPYREKALRLWAFFGVKTTLVPMNWYTNNETYQQKYQRVSDAITVLTFQKNTRVVLVGESAGGSMAINAFAGHPDVDGLITIAGVNTTLAPVAEQTLKRGPAFAVSRQLVDGSIRSISRERFNKIHTVSALVDTVVTARRSQITHAHNHRVWTVGHLPTIAICLTILSGYIVSLAKRASRV